MSEVEYRKRIEEALDTGVLGESLIPELGRPVTGKVRDIYFTETSVLMVATDRVSAFDYVLPHLIPFKGAVLNRLSSWAMEATSDIVPNALVKTNIDPNVVVQNRYKNVGIECIVRGYLWGSMAADYEKGGRRFCGLEIPDGLIRFQKFDPPLFTPTTKAEQGAHDENMTAEEVNALLGKETAAELQRLSLELYNRGSELAAKQGLVLIDTKYEFGTDKDGKLYVIDEVNTPDSSRLVDAKELSEKWPKIAEAMATGQYKTVTDLLIAQPALKVKEFSKQYVRDLLLEGGFKPGGVIPTLTREQIVESSFRYISVCERITGEKFQFPTTELAPHQRLIKGLVDNNLAVGACAVIMAGSDSDRAHLEKLTAQFKAVGVPSQIRICSAHKQPAKLQEVLEFYNKSLEPILIVGCAGGTDALSGTASFHSYWPVVTCSPDGANPTALTNPPGSSNAFILRPDNVARFALQVFSHVNPKFRATLAESIKEKVEKLVAADLTF